MVTLATAVQFLLGCHKFLSHRFKRRVTANFMLMQLVLTERAQNLNDEIVILKQKEHR